MNCRHCNMTLQHVFVDLGSAPPSNAYLRSEQLNAPEIWYPLRVMVCDHCWLVQTEDFAAAEQLFDADYAYFSGFSSSWVAHTEQYAQAMIKRLKLGKKNKVVEVATNDGTALKHFQDRGIPCLGIEPTSGTAAAARVRGIPVIEEFFGIELGKRLAGKEGQADLIIANNVLAHVPDINDFVSGFAHLLKPQGVATFEFPYLLRLVSENQFDTIYHEHFSYLSLTTVERIFRANGLDVFDVEELPTHGGSLRVYAQRSGVGECTRVSIVDEFLEMETQTGMQDISFYNGFQSSAEAVKDELICFLIRAKGDRKTVVAYGAAAKGNTLLNFAGVRPDLINMVADKNPAKQGKFMPGSRIPIRSPEEVIASRPDYVVILPWNIAAEVQEQWKVINDWSGQFVTAIPSLKLL